MKHPHQFEFWSSVFLASVPKIKIPLTAVSLAAALALFWIPGSATWAQREVNITSRDGTQHRGHLFAISEYSYPFTVEAFEGGYPIFVVDDGLRRVFFNSRIPAENIRPVDAPRDQFSIYQRVHKQLDKRFIGAVAGETPFDEFGRRTITIVESDGQRHTYVQGITKITPRYVVVQGIRTPKGRRHFDMRLALSTIPPEVIESLLHRQITDPNSITQRQRLVAFFIEADMLQQAARELAAMRLKFPQLPEEELGGRTRLQTRIHRRALDEIRFRFAADQNEFAKKLWESYRDKDKLPAEILAEFRDVQEQIDQREKRRSATIESVEKIIQQAREREKLSAEQIQMLTDFAKEIRRDLNHSNIDRFATFERFLTDDKLKPLQKLAYALSGWFVGSVDATNNFAVASSMPAVRSLVNEYLQSADEARREQILIALRKLEASTPKTLGKMLPMLKPPLAPEKVDLDQPMRFTVQIPMTAAQRRAQKEQAKENGKELPDDEEEETTLPVDYLVQLPPEYDPLRKYPCIVALPSVGQSPQLEIDWWCGRYLKNLGVHSGAASRHGYIVISPRWYRPGQSEYRFSVSEHAAVLRTYRDALRRFSIDTDRVFLSGHFRGGDAAWDIGLAHPDLWAGVIPVSAAAGKYVLHYYENIGFSNLPFYVVLGDADPGVRTTTEMTTLNRWLKSSKFDATVIEYRGRGGEHFLEEQKFMLQWMKNKQRKWIPTEFYGKSLRPTDNFFWNIEVAQTPVKSHVSPVVFNVVKQKDTFKMGCEQKPGVNRFRVQPRANGEGVSFWLGPEFVDFGQPVVIEGRGPKFQQTVQPSRRVILEDVRRRGDRQHPFWARLYCEKMRWKVVDETTAPE